MSMRLGCLLNEETLGDPTLLELQYASIAPSANLSAPTISFQDVDKEFSHYFK